MNADRGRVEREVQWVAQQLQRRIAAAGLAQKEVERRLGWSTGYLSQVLRGKVHLKFTHVLAVLAAIGETPPEFFAALYPKAGRARDHGAERESTAAEARRREELRWEVETIMREILAREGLAGRRR